MAEVWRPVSHRRLRPLGHGSPTWPLPRPPRGSLSRPGPPRQASCATERPLTRQFTSGLGLLHLERPTCHVPGTQLRPPAAQAARPRPSQSVCPHTDALPPPLTSVLGPGSRSPPSRCLFLGRTQGLKSIPTESHFNQRGVPRSTHVASVRRPHRPPRPSVPENRCAQKPELRGDESRPTEQAPKHETRPCWRKRRLFPEARWGFSPRRTTQTWAPTTLSEHRA